MHTYNPKQANKGAALEAAVEYQNELYANRGICNIQKISTPWKVIRQGNKIVSAFPEGKSTLDYRGTVRGGIPVSFDAKESEVIEGLPLKYIAEHQIDYMRAAIPLGEVTFILCQIKPFNKYYIIPGAAVIHYWDRWQVNKRKRGFNTILVEKMLPIRTNVPGYIMDYLPVAIRACRAPRKEIAHDS